MVNCWEFQSLPQLELPSPEEGKPPEVSLGNHGLPCCLCHLFTLTSMLRMSSLLFKSAITHIAIPHVHFGSLFFQAPHPFFNVVCCGGACIVFVIPWGDPGPLALILFSTTASAIAWPPSCMVFTIASNCAMLLAQLAWPVKLNLTSLAFPKGSPSLSDYHPKNKITSLGTRTTASVIHSWRPSWNIPAISELLHTWEGGGWSPSLPLKSLWHGCNSTSDHHVHGDLVNAQVIEIVQMAICCVVWIKKVLWKKHPSKIVLPPMMPPLPSDLGLYCLYHLPHLHEMMEGEAPFSVSAPPLATFLCFPMWKQ